MITSQKQLKREIFQVKSNLEDKDIFMSNEYSLWLTQMIQGIKMSRSFNGSGHMFDTPDGDIAYTNGKEVHINYSSSYAMHLNKKEKHQLYTGLNLHECGHLEVTDFSLDKKILEKLQAGVIYPAPPDNPYLIEVENFLASNGPSLIIPIFLDLENCIEDGFVDRAIMTLVPGYADCLRFVREITKPTDDSSYKEQKANKLQDEVIFRNMVLSYARHGILLYDETETDELIEAFKEVKPIIANAVFNPSPLQRSKLTWSVFCYMFHFVKQQNDKKQQQNSQSGNSDPSQSGGQGNPQNGGNGPSANNNSAPSQSGTPNGNDGNGQQNASNSNPQNGANGTSANDSSSSSADGSSSSSQNGGDGNASNGQQGSNTNSQNGSAASQNGASNSIPSLEDSLREMGNNGNRPKDIERKNVPSPSNDVLSDIKEVLKGANDPMTNSPAGQNSSKGSASGDTQSGSGTPSNGLTGKSEDDSSPTLEQIAQKIAENKVGEQQEKNIMEQLKDDRNPIITGIHRGVQPTVKRMDYSLGMDEYNKRHHELDQIVKRFVKTFKREIKERQLGDTMNGLYSGKRVSSRDLYRMDKKIMSKKILPEDIPDMAVGIMLDLSGSMRGSRVDAAKACAYITYQFCRELKIPVFVIGHNDRSDVVLYSAVDENCLDDKDKYRIFSLSTSGSNRDGFALRYCLQKLEKIQAEQKLMLVVSDGRPNSTNYGLAEGRKDCQDAVSKALKKGIVTIAAAIGDAEQVKSVYKEGISDKNSAVYMDLSDLEKLPKAFIKIIKEKL